jgi:PelA/Pel-15E family pectate lyase
MKAAQLTAPKMAPHNRKEFELHSKMPNSEFTSESGLALAKAIVSWQLPCGGWSKAIDYDSGPREPGMQFTAQDILWHYAGTFDNRTTTEQLKFLARSHSLHANEAVKTSVERGIDYMLAAQMPNGGWPQCFPLEGGYHDAITLNDDAMVHVLETLQLIVAGKDGFDWIDAGRRERAQAALDRGHAALIKLQRGIWSPQYDLISQEVIGARGFELAGLSAAESAVVLGYLMKVKSPSKEMIQSIETGLAWFREHQLPPGEEGKPRWARFNDPVTLVPFFPGKRDGRAHADYDEMRKTNPGGYDFFSTKGNDVIGKWADKWRKGLAKK